jgi:hypothetical protein
MGYEDRPDGFVERGGVKIGYYAYDRSGLAVHGEEFAEGLARFLEAQGACIGSVDQEFAGAVSGSDVMSCQEFHLIDRE